MKHLKGILQRGLFSWRTQNLNESKRYWKHGRGWLTILPHRWDLNQTPSSIRVEWVLPGCTQGIELDVDGMEGEILLTLGLPGMTLYICLERFLPYRWYPDCVRSTGITVFEGHFLQVKLWHDADNDRNDRFSWQRISFFLDDLFLGSAKYSESERTKHEVVLELPEGIYTLDCEEYVANWKRPRWRKNSVRRFEITPRLPVGVPGKGENLWDLDDDAVYKSTIPAESLEEAVEKFKENILQTRQRYGGPDWIPRAD